MSEHPQQIAMERLEKHIPGLRYEETLTDIYILLADKLDELEHDVKNPPTVYDGVLDE